MTEGPKYGYHPKPSKSFLIVKQYYKEYGERIFAGSNINITTKGARNLGAFQFQRKICLKRRPVMEKSIGNTFKYSRKLNYKLLILHICSG